MCAYSFQKFQRDMKIIVTHFKGHPNIKFYWDLYETLMHEEEKK